MSNPKTSGQRLKLVAPSISYKRTLDELRAQRRVPLIERHLTIGGNIEQTVNSQEDRRRETLVGVMQTRLREVQNHARDEFACAQLESRAVHDFERSR